MTRSSDEWRVKPGSFDANNVYQIFPANNQWGIPELGKDNIQNLPEGLVAYGSRVDNPIAAQGLAVHFFLDDYRIERIWHQPERTIQSLQRFGAALTPDYSLYRDWPLALQLWNVYRSRWCGAYWQSRGISVIPTVSWSTPESYEFCFEGLPKGVTLAISTLGIGQWDKVGQKLFVGGLAQCLSRLNPHRLLVYGETTTKWSSFLYEELPQIGVEVIGYPSRWQQIRARLEPAEIVK